ncbi:ephrin type-B receptor 3-like [Branchiostoma lanceolatum]|uniref:ephrin type-B receptor 3-like n=1 Tax=Branchiostoma lanceolatum TaxID=7740 RepID=UPI003451F62D
MATSGGVRSWALCYWSIFTHVWIVFAAEEILLDTRSMSTLGGWTTYPVSDRGGWIEVSNINSDGHPVRTYQVCQVRREDQNNWLRAEWIPKRQGRRIYVEIKFSIRECRDIPNVVSCKETFDLYYFESEYPDATEDRPAWNDGTYTKVDRIAADGRFSHVNTEIINTEVRDIGPIFKRGFYLAFQDSGACISLLSVRVYYKVCPTITEHYAIFNKTVTGPSITSLVQAEGQCIPNSEPVGRQPTVQCTGTGEWTLFTGSCRCLPGYEPQRTVAQRCDACKEGTFKPNAGNYECMPCPLYSHATRTGETRCTCDRGYYRSPRDKPTDPCTAPPSKPRNIISTVNMTTVELQWETPVDNGGRHDLHYKIVCWRCHDITCVECRRAVQYRPAKVGLNNTMVTIEGLMAYTKYRFEVHAENGVSSTSRVKDRFESITLKTNVAPPSQIQSIIQAASTETAMTIEWSVPSQPNGKILEYRVQFYRARDGPGMTAIIKVDGDVQSATVENLENGEEYVFQVQARTIAGYGKLSEPITLRTSVNGAQAPLGSDQPVLIAAIAAAGGFVLVLSLFILVCVVWRRKNRKPPSDMDKLEYANGEVRLPGFVAPRLKTYIDPHTYEDPQHAVREFARELEPSCLTIEQVIGGGEFGDVCKGRLKVGKGQYLDVAIKTLKPGSTDKMKDDFLTEASIMGQFNDPNIIKLQGVITKSQPVMIVTDYMENGSLDTFLRKHDGKFQVTQLVGMIRGVASGMRYLADMNYVHRDLAARNVLINSQLVCKVSDFGLSRVLGDDPDAAYTTNGGKIPIRWTSPEAIAFRKFTSASDVWSYGVLVWEVMSYGERPYWNWSNQDVIKSVEAGYRLPPPMDCPQAIYQLMTDCWERERNSRPKITLIVERVDRMIRNPAVLKVLAQPRPMQPSLQPVLPTVPQWLDSMKMGRYRDNFTNGGYSSMDLVMRMNIRDLQGIGVTMLAHQKKILNSIQNLHTQLSDCWPPPPPPLADTPPPVPASPPPPLPTTSPNHQHEPHTHSDPTSPHHHPVANGSHHPIPSSPHHPPIANGVPTPIIQGTPHLQRPTTLQRSPHPQHRTPTHGYRTILNV